ncbi:MAG: M23 family metallopeptidase [Flavobacteriales bacterium]
MKTKLLSIFVLYSVIQLKSQENYPQDFSSPLKIPMILSGTFGELRSNHFHAGLDIKTQGKEGLPVHAIGGGYVSRIKVSPVGYGKAVYITHPNGYTSVYAHLKEFKGDIAEYVKKQQYARKSFAVDLFPKTKSLPVTQDQMIALSGNSGGSGGPHLHFEIRETSSEVPINPMKFGYQFTDTQKPLVSGVYVYPIDGMAGGNKKYVYKVGFSKGTLTRNTPIPASGKVGIGVKTYDRLNGASNMNGVYSIDLYVNDQHTYNFTAEKVSFAQTRYINSHTDYHHKKTNNGWINKCFLDPGNKLDMYQTAINQGIIDVENEKTYHIRLVVKDFKGNERISTFHLIGRENKPEIEVLDGTSKKFKWNTAHKYENEDIKLHFPANSFYSDIDFTYSREGQNHKVGDITIPVHKLFTVSIKPEDISAQDLNKTVLTRNGKGIGGEYKNGWIIDKSKEFGIFALKVDRTPPKIVSVNLSNGSTFTSNSTIKIKISDNLAGIAKYEGTIDGKWVLMDYDKKYRLLTFNFKNENISTGNHIFGLTVTDKKGNQTYFERTFTKK